MQRLLTFVDFSDVTAAVVKAATQIALAFRMEMLLLHVSTPDAESEGRDLRADKSRTGVASEMRRIHRALHIMSLECGKLGIHATALLVRGTSQRGNPIPKMLSETARLHPALIVMGTHGSGRLHEVLLGSASTAVVRKANCPVLLVPSRATLPIWPDRPDTQPTQKRPSPGPSRPSRPGKMARHRKI